jgi:hypothetical protein
MKVGIIGLGEVPISVRKYWDRKNFDKGEQLKNRAEIVSKIKNNEINNLKFTNMEKLFNESEVFVATRPEKATAQQIEKFYLENATEILDNKWATGTLEDVISDLEQLYPFNDSGYEMAKESEGFNMQASYDIETSFIEFLDCLSSDFYELVRNNVKEWVKIHNPKPIFEIGTRLLIEKDLSRNTDLKAGNAYYITGYSEKEAYYTISKNSEQKGGYCFPYEKIEQCCALSLNGY